MSEDESEEITEASEALEATSSVIEDLETGQALLESPSCSCEFSRVSFLLGFHRSLDIFCSLDYT